MLIIELNILAIGLLHAILTQPSEALGNLRLWLFKNNIKPLYCSKCFVGWLTIIGLLFTYPLYLLPLTALNMLILELYDRLQ